MTDWLILFAFFVVLWALGNIHDRFTRRRVTPNTVYIVPRANDNIAALRNVPSFVTVDRPPSFAEGEE